MSTYQSMGDHHHIAAASANGNLNTQTAVDLQHYQNTEGILDPRPRFIGLEDAIYFREKLHQSVKRFNFYVVMCAVYIGANLVGLIGVSQSEEKFQQDSLWLHILEFVATFIFSLVESVVVRSAMSASSIAKNQEWYQSPVLVYGCMIMLISMTFLSAVLVTFDIDKYEKAAHWVEFVSQIPIVVLDLFLINQATTDATWRSVGRIVAVLLLVITVIQMMCYGQVFDSDEYKAEQNTHYIEFTVSVVNALYTILGTVAQVHTVRAEINNIDSNWTSFGLTKVLISAEMQDA